jgi:probable F420-dependent oxidoreductase
MSPGDVSVSPGFRPDYHPAMDFGLVLPTMPEGASAEGIEAAADASDRLGYSTVWTTDHVLVPHSAAGDYGLIYEAVVTLAYVGARHSRLRLGTSVIVVPQRNAVLLAKELASLDALTRGRLIVGIGLGWNEAEFENLGEGDRFHVRGAYVDESVRLWRHLWSGSQEPFEGRFHTIRDFAFGPVPAQGADLPILFGGRSELALKRAGRIGDWYQATSSNPDTLAARIPILRAAAERAGRPLPRLSVRVNVRFGDYVGGSYAMSGSPEAMVSEIDRFSALGVEHLALAFGETDPERVVAAAERFDREIAVRLRATAH